MAKPGIMLYFDILDPIRVLPDADKGRLLVAMLEYGQSGKVPQLDGTLAIVWGFVKPKIDKDSEAYSKLVLKRQYATACRDRKKRGEPEITFEEWLADMGGGYQTVSHDNTWYPTTTTTPTTTTSTATTPTTTPTTSAECGGGQENDFYQLWVQYPEERRGSRQIAAEVFRQEITSSESAATALENLAQWKRSEQWSKEGGRYVPYLDNWLIRGTWKEKPKKLAGGQARELDEDEILAIQRMLSEDSKLEGET